MCEGPERPHAVPQRPRHPLPRVTWAFYLVASSQGGEGGVRGDPESFYGSVGLELFYFTRSYRSSSLTAPDLETELHPRLRLYREKPL